MIRPRIPLAATVGVALLAALLALARPQWLLEAEFARQRWLAGARLRATEVDGQRWVWLEAGNGPTMLLVHGFTGSKENWLPLIARLRDRYHLIAPDLPGWNASERVPGAHYGVRAQAQRLSAFIDALHLAPVDLVGHSMGGHISGLLAAEHPQQVEHLALLAAAGVPFKENAFAAAVRAGEDPFLVRNRADLHRQLALVFEHPPWVPWPLDAELARQRRADIDFERAVLARITAEDERYALHARLADIHVPVLLLWCAHDRVIDPSAMPVFAAGLRNSRSVLLPDCGHMANMERPAQVAAALHALHRSQDRDGASRRDQPDGSR